MTVIDPDTIPPETVTIKEALKRMEAAHAAAVHVTDLTLTKRQDERVRALAVERALAGELQELRIKALSNGSTNYKPITADIKMATDGLKRAAKDIDKLVADFGKAAQFANAAARVVALLI